MLLSPFFLLPFLFLATGTLPSGSLVSWGILYRLLFLTGYLVKNPFFSNVFIVDLILMLAFLGGTQSSWTSFYIERSDRKMIESERHGRQSKREQHNRGDRGTTRLERKRNDTTREIKLDA